MLATADVELSIPIFLMDYSSISGKAPIKISTGVSVLVVNYAVVKPIHPRNPIRISTSDSSFQVLSTSGIFCRELLLLLIFVQKTIFFF